MINARVTGLRSVELGVTDLDKSAAFYRDVWGLEEVVSGGDTIHMRGTGGEHHVLTLRARPKAAFLGVHFAAANHAAVNKLHDQVKAHGATIVSAPAALARDEGGGYGFAMRSPEGQPVFVSCDVDRLDVGREDRSRPTKLTHVVLNATKTDAELAFFLDALGFRHSDSTDMMEFVRCTSDHHSLALVRTEGPSLNHMAYEMTNIDGLMRGAGRMKQAGYNIEWGLGRHGPGNNVFTYFVEPNGFVTEYTTDVDQVDEATYEKHDAAYWRAFPGRPCRWGMAGHPSNRLKVAMGGNPVAAMASTDERCEDVMAKTLAR
jgi:catechol 2,3-dioxygenase-like lactoylglutathione lyase family enzyme